MSCLKYDKLSHPDLHFVFPTVKKSSTKKSISDNDVLDERRGDGKPLHNHRRVD